MSCDIHAFIEVKIAGVWNYYGNPHIHQLYKDFSKLAGVRAEEGEDPQMVPQRGLPKDTTYMTQLFYKKDGGNLEKGSSGDAHGVSWCSSGELIEFLNWWSPRNVHRRYPNDRFLQMFLFGNSFRYFKVYKEDYPKFLEDFRMLYWFTS